MKNSLSRSFHILLCFTQKKSSRHSNPSHIYLPKIRTFWGWWKKSWKLFGRDFSRFMGALNPLLLFSSAPQTHTWKFPSRFFYQTVNECNFFKHKVKSLSIKIFLPRFRSFLLFFSFYVRGKIKDENKINGCLCFPRFLYLVEGSCNFFLF